MAVLSVLSANSIRRAPRAAVTTMPECVMSKLVGAPAPVRQETVLYAFTFALYSALADKT